MAKLELTDRQKLFLEFLFAEAEGDVKTAMNLAGYAETTPTSVVLNSLAEEIYDRTQKFISTHAPRAALAVVGVIKDPTLPGTQNRLRAAEQLLDRAGHVKTEKVSISADTGVGVFILPPKDNA